jgi:hypothetical protein
MATGETETEAESDVQPTTEPAPTPLISAADLSVADYPLQHIDEHRFYALVERANRIADNAHGSTENHIIGKLGEDSFAHAVGIADRLDTTVYADGGDGGVDLTYRGATIDVKTVGRHRHDPALTVDAYEPLTADYYVLASRVGKMDCRLIGYAPRDFVANAPVRLHNGEPYHIVEQEYLFPLTF